MRGIILMFMLNLAFHPLAMAQLRTVSGKITDDAGLELPGANVEGATNRTSSDKNVLYQISVSGNASVLVFSFIGYKTQNIKVNDQITINVMMQPDLRKLSELKSVSWCGCTPAKPKKDTVDINAFKHIPLMPL